MRGTLVAGEVGCTGTHHSAHSLASVWHKVFWHPPTRGLEERCHRAPGAIAPERTSESSTDEVNLFSSNGNVVAASPLVDMLHPVTMETEESTKTTEVMGRIHSTEAMSAVDGPGLRFLVFLQGCIARCQFCSNPDTWDFCAGHKTSSKTIAEQMERCLPFMKASGGGLTCSGGEPLMQPKFVQALFKEAHSIGVNTCLDTNGQGSKECHWDVVLPHTDMVLVCVKHLNPVKYKELVGGTAKPSSVLNFVKELNERRIPFWIRYVLIPGYTMDSEDIDLLVDYCLQQSSSLQGVELLPYHILGLEKWMQLGVEYPMKNVSPPSRQEVAAVVKRMENAGIKVLCDVQTAGNKR